jgi:hypothetical protein
MWMKCSACKTDIGYGQIHWICSVSTCNRARMRLVFCSVECWDSHVADARHRDAWAVEERAPTQEQWQRELASSPAETHSPSPAPAPAASPARVVVRPSSAVPAAPVTGAVGSAPVVALADVADRDMLIVISKMKKYIKDRSGFNCSDAVGDMLSEHVRAICDDAIRAAGRDERKTVLDRDVPRPRR